MESQCQQCQLKLAALKNVDIENLRVAIILSEILDIRLEVIETKMKMNRRPRMKRWKKSRVNDRLKWRKQC